MVIKKACLWLFLLSLSSSGLLRADWQNLFTQVRLSLGTSLGHYSIPFLRRRVAVGCSLELASHPLTVNDICTMIIVKLKDIKEDLNDGALIARLVFNELKNYIYQKPVNAALIGSSLAVALLLTRYLLAGISGSGSCPYCEVTRHRITKKIHHRD